MKASLHQISKIESWTSPLYQSTALRWLTHQAWKTYQELSQKPRLCQSLSSNHNTYRIIGKNWDQLTLAVHFLLPTRFQTRCRGSSRMQFTQFYDRIVTIHLHDSPGNQRIREALQKIAQGITIRVTYTSRQEGWGFFTTIRSSQAISSSSCEATFFWGAGKRSNTWGLSTTRISSRRSDFYNWMQPRMSTLNSRSRKKTLIWISWCLHLLVLKSHQQDMASRTFSKQTAKHYAKKRVNRSWVRASKILFSKIRNCPQPAAG